VSELARTKKGDLARIQDPGPAVKATEQWLTTITNDNTRRSYREALGHFAAWLSDRLGGDPFDVDSLPVNIGQVITTGDVKAYRKELATASRAMANHRLSVLRKWVSELEEAGMIHPSRAAAIRGVQGYKGPDRSLRSHLTTEEIQALLDAIDDSLLIGKRDKALIALLSWTGLRRAELCSLKVGQYQSANGHKVLDGIERKGGSRGWVKVAVPLQRALEEWLEAAGLEDPGAPMFCAVDKKGRPSGRPLSGDAVYRIVKARSEAAGFEGITPHALRRSFATNALREGASPTQVQKAGGWRSLAMVDRYDQGQQSLDQNAVDHLHFDL